MLKHKVLLLALLLAGVTFGAQAQVKSGSGATDPVEHPWYVGIGGGTSFGQCTFSSITEAGVRNWGIQGGLFGGYNFNRLISLELGFQYGRQSQFNLECCPYWLSTDGVWKATQVIDMDGWYYDDLHTATQWFKLALQANFNMLSFIRSNRNWSLDLSPQIALVNTQTTWKGNLSKGQGYLEKAQPSNFHFGVGGQVSVGYNIAQRCKISLYGGVSALTGKRFDMIPNKAHHTNMIWEAGLKVAVCLGKGKSKQQSAVQAEIEQAIEAARQAELREAQEKEARERAAAQQAAAAQKAEQERLEAQAQALALAQAQACEEAFNTAIDNVYFAPGSDRIADEYIPELEKILSILQKYPEFKLQVRGHASRSGEKSYNQQLSLLRAESVQYWFIGHQIGYDRVEDVKGCGVDPQASEKEGRRVEIKFVK